jgi:hypothetical protein
MDDGEVDGLFGVGGQSRDGEKNGERADGHGYSFN